MVKLTWKYVKMVENRNDIDLFIKQCAVSLPQDYLACVLQNNGGRPDKKIFDTNESKGRVIKSLLSFNHGDLETIYDAYNILQKEDKNLIPIASDPSGNYICYEKNSMSIVLWNHEMGTSEFIAETFTDFLGMLR